MRRKRKKRRKRSRLQSNLPHQCSRDLLMAKAIASFVSVNKVEKGEEEEQVEIRTTMPFSVAMQQSCTCCQGNCFFPVNNEEEKMEKGKEVE